MLIQRPPCVYDFYDGACHMLKQFALAATSHQACSMQPSVRLALLHSWRVVQKANLQTPATRSFAAKPPFRVSSKVWQKG